MEVYELNSTQYVKQFYVKSCAEVFQRVYGGTIDIVERQDDDSNQKNTEQKSQTQ